MNATITQETSAQRGASLVGSGTLVRRGVFSRDWPGLLAAIVFMPLFLFVFLLTAERRDETLAQWTRRNFGRPFLDEPNVASEPRPGDALTQSQPTKGNQ